MTALEIVRIPVLSDNYVWLAHEPTSGETLVVENSLTCARTHQSIRRTRIVTKRDQHGLGICQIVAGRRGGGRRGGNRGAYPVGCTDRGRGGCRRADHRGRATGQRPCSQGNPLLNLAFGRWHGDCKSSSSDARHSTVHGTRT